MKEKNNMDIWSQPCTSVSFSTDYDALFHKFLNTPVQLIWDVREKIWGNKNVNLIVQEYDRKSRSNYYGHKKIEKKIPMVTQKEFFKAVNKERGGLEWAFIGFQVIGGPVQYFDPFMDAFGIKPRFTYDFAKCDMKVTAQDIDKARPVLAEMKAYFNNAELHLYKTTSSFHVYIAHMLDQRAVGEWLKFLVALNVKHPGIMDVAWLEMNQQDQPIRITKTAEREIPTLYSVI
jgi:hypothetical protein